MKNLSFCLVLISLISVGCREAPPAAGSDQKGRERSRPVREVGTGGSSQETADPKMVYEAAVSKLTPSELRTRWSEMKESDLSEGEKALLRQAILRRIIETQGIESGLALVDTIPKGVNRMTLVEAAFEFSNQPLSELMAVRNGLKDPDDRESAYHELEYAARTYGKYTISDLEGLDLKNGRDAEILKGAATFLVEDLKSRHGIGTAAAEQKSQAEIRGVFEKIEDFMVKGNISEAQARDVVGSLTLYPFTCWELLQEKGGGSLLEGQREKIVSGMAYTRPKEAIDLMLKSGIAKETDFKVVFDTWLSNDSEAPKEWFAQNQSTMPAGAAGQVMVSFAGTELAAGDLEGAREWAGKIADPEVRKRVEGQVWGVERDNLRNAVGKDPAATVQSIVSGQSKYGDYWLEEAVGVWVSKDFDKAQGWYEANWKSLPKEKAQYVAAAFANQALKQGDAETAGQWVGLIQDPKTKQRIQAGIDKAGTNAK
jgi:hypothetical protein